MKVEKKEEKLSVEQRKIIDSFYGDNLIVNAAAGSGKTKTIVEIIYDSNKYNLSWKTLVLSYNTKLVSDTKERIKSKGIADKSYEVHTFHSFATKKSKKTVLDDFSLKEFNQIATLTLNEYDTIIIDEAQDITPLYWSLILKILKCNPLARVMFIGDSNQEIYSFKEANSMFLENIDKLIPSKTWKKLEINGSFRVPNATWHLLNGSKQYKNESFNALNRDGLVNISTFDYGSNLIEETILNKIKQYGQENIFVLSYSTNSENIKSIANKLTLNGFNVYVSRSDNEEKVNPIETMGKIVFSTVHQVKGLERKVVVMLNFNQRTEALYNTDKFNKLFYVAATRNIEELHIFYNKKDSLPTLMKYLKDQIYGLINEDDEIEANDDFQRFKKVTEIVKFLPNQIEEKFKELIEFEQINTKDENIEISNNITYNNLVYNISDINGIYAENIFERNDLYKFKKENKTLLEIMKGFKLISNSTSHYINKILDKKVNTFLELCFIKNSIENNDLTRLKPFEDNINNFPTWIDEKNSVKINLRMLEYLSDLNLQKQFQVTWKNVVGMIDLYQEDANIVHEVKFVTKVSFENYLQVAIYLFLIHKTNINKNIPSGNLINIRDNSRYTINIKDYDKFEEVLLEALNKKEKEISVEEFINTYNENEIEAINKNLIIKKPTSNIKQDDSIGLTINNSTTKKVTNNIPTTVKKTNNKSIKTKRKYDKIVFFDTETTSLQGEIIQLALVVYENEVKVDEMNLYFKNDLRIHYEAYSVHKISEDFLKNKPKFYEEFDKIHKYLTGDYLWIAHNSAFDVYRLFFNFKHYSEEIGDKLNDVKFDYLCSLQTMKKLAPNHNSYKLEHLVYDYNLERGAFHDGLFDALSIVRILKKVDNTIEGYIDRSIKSGYKIKKFNYVEWLTKK
ncbi:UvrD-helicase domain-containing protein [Mycoplasma sp. OR1901]|uniref:UvrD-helicase domain-containing protein n=1 Tax=Mycoplasma sp. OR1901 TaxID=2742195 RepID=UPI00158401A6|nr:UvrD-helicase domain-containing protein [Mycoplasma sp. OR1901]QKT05601.1 AAA family ATPase [Mycoplasma sp. OR1901]